MIRFTIKTLTAFTTAALLCLAPMPTQAGCYNNAQPGGGVWLTGNPSTRQVQVYDQDNFAIDGGVRLFFRAGRHSRNVYVKEGIVTFPSGTTDVFAVNINTCGGRMGEGYDTFLKTVIVQ